MPYDDFKPLSLWDDLKEAINNKEIIKDLAILTKQVVCLNVIAKQALMFSLKSMDTLEVILRDKGETTKLSQAIKVRKHFKEMESVRYEIEQKIHNES